jgi:hypothetical protein
LFSPFWASRTPAQPREVDHTEHPRGLPNKVHTAAGNRGKGRPELTRPENLLPSRRGSIRRAPPAAIRNNSLSMAMLTLRHRPWQGESDRAELGRDVQPRAGGAKPSLDPCRCDGERGRTNFHTGGSWHCPLQQEWIHSACKMYRLAGKDSRGVPGRGASDCVTNKTIACRVTAR